MPETAPISVEELLAKAKQPAADAMVLHPFYRGKVEVALKCRIKDFNDFAIWYTPGVAASCRAIAENPELVYDHTHKWNTVAVVSDGTRVLGLGDIGPKAGPPVMEGKALLYKYLGGVDPRPKTGAAAASGTARAFCTRAAPTWRCPRPSSSTSGRCARAPAPKAAGA